MKLEVIQQFCRACGKYWATTMFSFCIYWISLVPKWNFTLQNWMNIKMTDRAMVLSPDNTVSPELQVCWVISPNTPIIMVHYYAHQLIFLLFSVLSVSVCLSYPSLHHSPSWPRLGEEEGACSAGAQRVPPRQAGMWRLVLSPHCTDSGFGSSPACVHTPSYMCFHRQQLFAKRRELNEETVSESLLLNQPCCQQRLAGESCARTAQPMSTSHAAEPQKDARAPRGRQLPSLCAGCMDDGWGFRM